MMVDEHESMKGVDAWGRDGFAGPSPSRGARDHLRVPIGNDRWEGHEDLVALHNGRGLPYVDFPGTPLPKDPTRDRLIIESLRQAGALPRNKKDVLDYDRSKLMYETVRDYFNDTDQLMNTERWLGSFVEKNKVIYTDRDEQTYILRGGVRHPIVIDDEDDEFEEDLPETDAKII